MNYSGMYVYFLYSPLGFRFVLYPFLIIAYLLSFKLFPFLFYACNHHIGRNFHRRGLRMKVGGGIACTLALKLTLQLYSNLLDNKSL